MFGTVQKNRPQTCCTSAACWQHGRMEDPSCEPACAPTQKVSAGADLGFSVCRFALLMDVNEPYDARRASEVPLPHPSFGDLVPKGLSGKCA